MKPCQSVDGCCGSTDVLITGVPPGAENNYEKSSDTTASNNQTARWTREKNGYDSETKTWSYSHQGKDSKVYLFYNQSTRTWFAGPKKMNSDAAVLKANATSEASDAYNLKVSFSIF